MSDYRFPPTDLGARAILEWWLAASRVSRLELTRITLIPRADIYSNNLSPEDASLLARILEQRRPFAVEEPWKKRLKVIEDELKTDGAWLDALERAPDPDKILEGDQTVGDFRDTLRDKVQGLHEEASVLSGLLKGLPEQWEGLDFSDRRSRLRCQRCGHGWTSRSERPARCPACQSANWNNTITIYDHVCGFCSFEWQSRLESPKACPSCKRYGWQRVTAGA